MGKNRNFLIGGGPETDEQQRLKLLELVREHLHERFGHLSFQGDVTTVQGSTEGQEEFSFSAAPELPVGDDLRGETHAEASKKVAIFNGPRPRTQEDIDHDLERLGLGIQNLALEKSRVETEIDTWLSDNAMAPRTALNYVEELVRELRKKQVTASEPEVRKHLWGKVGRR